MVGEVRAGGHNMYVWETTSYSYNNSGDIVKTVSTDAYNYNGAIHVDLGTKTTDTGLPASHDVYTVVGSETIQVPPDQVPPPVEDYVDY